MKDAYKRISKRMRVSFESREVDWNQMAEDCEDLKAKLEEVREMFEEYRDDGTLEQGCISRDCGDFYHMLNVYIDLLDNNVTDYRDKAEQLKYEDEEEMEMDYETGVYYRV